MRRDWDLIRDILTKLEDTEAGDRAPGLNDFPSEQQKLVAGHVELLIEAGLVDGDVHYAMGHVGPYTFTMNRLTWDGHEFLDSIRSPQVWEETKAQFSATGVTMTLDLVKRAALAVGSKLLDLAATS